MKTTAIAAAGIAAVIAVALIVAAVYLPGSTILGNKTNTSSSGSSTSGTSGSGSFAVLMTDPPTVPNGVTDLFMTYNKVGVHIAGDSNDSGWQILTESGTIDLMQSINVSQTIASANLQNGEKLNALGFNITSVIVTYNNGTTTGNYTADLVYGQSRLFVPIPGGIIINTSEDQAVMIDMTPKVLLLGSPSDPTFAFLPSAVGYVIPNAEVSAQSHLFIGERIRFQNSPQWGQWWRSILDNTSFAVQNVVLAPNGLSITVKNTGSVSIVFHFAAVTSDVSISGGSMPAPAISDIFVVEPSGALAQLNTSSASAMLAQIGAAGYLLAPGASVTFTYSGSVSIGMQSYYATALGITHPVVSGTNYIVRLFGNGFVAAAGTTAVASITSTTTTSD